jgi:hypothetical protein
LSSGDTREDSDLSNKTWEGKQKEQVEKKASMKKMKIWRRKKKSILSS